MFNLCLHRFSTSMGIYLFVTFAKEVIFSPVSICFLVVWLVCQQGYAKTTWQISMKLVKEEERVKQTDSGNCEIWHFSTFLLLCQFDGKTSVIFRWLRNYQQCAAEIMGS